MTEKKEFICISCPLGCALTVTMKEDTVVQVEGYTCSRGKAYGEKEATNPTRILTSSVKVRGGILPVVSVKTASDIPKGKIIECAGALRDVEAAAPVRIGDVLVRDFCGTGVDLIATKNVPEKIS